MSHIYTAWPTSVAEEAYWQTIRTQYLIAPDEIYLNTGSFGSQPKPVFEKLLEILEDVERNPTRHRAKYNGVVDDSRARLAAFVHAPAEDIAFATNVTMAMNMVVHGLDWRPGDEILASDQEYGAIDNCLHLAERRYGVVIKRAQIPIPPERPEDISRAFEREFTDRTRLVFCSHITTRTGLVTPIKTLAQLAHDRGALIAVDGAHAPGMIPLNLRELGCDFYGGNCHKWLCAPKGTGFLYASPSMQARLHHVVVSWGYSREGARRGADGILRINNRPFMWGIENWGTRDQACFAAVSTAVAFQEAIGKKRIRKRGQQLAAYLRDRLAETGWAKQLTPSAPALSGSISAFHLSGFDNLDLYDQYRITVPTAKLDGVHWMRVSTHICNGFDDVDHLVEALLQERKKAGYA